MFKKNTRKRLLAGALATVMMLTMCPSWALADDEDIALLPANEEIAVPVDDSTPAADPTETPADPTPSEPEAKPAENQNTAPAPSEGGANGDTDSAETGNSTNSTIPEGSENNSQNNNAASNSPENEISMASLDVDAYSLNNVQTIDAEYWITNRRAVADGTSTLEIASNRDGITDANGLAITDIVPNERDATTTDGSYHTVFWQARVQHVWHQGTGSNDDKTQFGTEITRIRYTNGKYGWDGKFEYLAKGSDEWTKFDTWTDHLVFYYLIRTEYSQMVQIDVSDWTVDKEDTQYRDRRSVTYQVIVDGGVDNGKTLASRKFWYNKAFKVSSVRVREIGNDPNYSIDRVVLDPLALGTVTDENGEYRFSLDLTQTKCNATVKIYVKPNVDPHQLTYVLNDGTITSDDDTYTPAGLVYPDAPVITPTAEKTDCVFDGWYTDEALTQKWTGTTMPNYDLTLYACFTPKQAPNPNPEPEPELTPAKYFVLLPNRGEPESGASQGKTNYLPNDNCNGGVDGKSTSTGYTGALTEAGVSAAGPNTYDDSTNGIYNVNGFGSDYLVPPTELGFFDKDNWTNGSYNDSSADTSILGENFNVNDIKIVWYTIKNQEDGYHVDGYVKNVAINVTYHSNFGTDATYNDGTKTGTNYTALDYSKTGLPTRDGYEFRGWYTDTACETPYTAKVLMTSLDLYAKWVPNNFEVSYFYQNDQGTETQFGNIDTYAFGTDVTVRTAHPEKEGYTFTGWTPATNVASIIKVVDGKFTMPAQNVCFNGTFAINHYTVTYKVDTEVVGTDVYDFNSDVVIRPVPTKEGYTFTGWKIGTADAKNFKMPADNVVINGTFAINRYTVTYKVDGKEVGTDVYDFNSDVVIRDVPTKEGYTFSGWKIGNADAKNFKMPADNVVIEGTFAKNSSGGHHHRRPTVTIPDDVPTGLNGDDHYAYIVGYPDKTVRPQNGITRAEVATIFFRLLTDETRDANSTKSNSYSDVAAGAWYNHAVSTLSAMGIVKGDSDGKFNPNAPITRAEFAAIAARFDDKANTTTADFSDIASHWAKNEISAASNNGWINGYPDGTFRPDNKITRAEAMTLVNRVLKRLPETAEDLHDDMIKWSDNSDASQWFYLAVQEATNSHYYQTKENQFEKWSELRDTRDWTELEK